MAESETFYCVACRFAYPLEKAAHIATGVHRDDELVGFCFLCVREIRRDAHSADLDDAEQALDEQAAGA